MVQITISDDVYMRIVAFKPVVESILEETLEFDNYIERLLSLVPDLILADFLGEMDAQLLLQSLQQLGHKYPVEVYTYIAGIMQQGQESIETQQRAELKRKLGFTTK